ncbi:MAG: hypothetical protein J3R72DRAFT_448466 [Linnemannia gamsii]|nr:MAG: hypothetical protein J3R72DRAFT_448466 [Linnemannia gamsii]
MPPAMGSSQMEATLSVISPRFATLNSQQNIVIGAGSGWTFGVCKLTLQNNRGNIQLDILWERLPSGPHVHFRSIHIFSRLNPLKAVKVESLHYNWTLSSPSVSQRVSILADTVTVGDKYDFDVVLSTDREALRTTSVSTPVPNPAPITKPVTSKEKSLISSLLKDPTSVDVCFTFTSDKTCSNIGLWAHRFVLSRHESFVKLIQDATIVQSLGGMALAEKAPESDGDSDAESISNRSINTVVTTTALPRGPMVGSGSKELVIKIDGVSLATFCVMLYYMYTGEIDRTVDPSRFVLSDTNKASLVWRDSTGKVEDSVDWRPLDQDSPWRLKDVTWKELMDAAVHFGLEELQDIAEDVLGIIRI